MPETCLARLHRDSEYFPSPYRPYIYIILMDCNISFLVLIRNAVSVPLRLFLLILRGKAFWTNVFEG